jgi:hypothetical protein
VVGLVLGIVVDGGLVIGGRNGGVGSVWRGLGF